MPHCKYIIRTLLTLLCCVPAFMANASHIFGVDLYYTNVGGNTYTVTLAVYGDCSGSAFFNLSSSSPVIEVYNGSTFLNYLTLTVQPPTNGIEVSPVCPAQAGNTTCSNVTSTLPGIKKFVYQGTITLPATSTLWRFLFNGNMGSSSTAGRSNGITNINMPGTGSVIQLVDTLNNTTSGNSSPTYNTIPTPYFCISTPANYNPAAVDPNGDNLSFDLVPAMDAGTGVSVNYVWPYNATAPLGVTAGTFSFSSANGQLSFTPNITQRADVVYNVRETVGGVLKGTSQREMTIVVLSPCTNNPPSGNMSAASAGTISGTNTITICNNVGLFSFHINPTDPDADTIGMTASGLPSGATFTVVNNNTPLPLGTFQWNTTSVAPGTYTFYINYVDRGCPLSSRQSLAYTIIVLPSPTLSFSLLSAATCTRKAVFNITPGTVSGPWTINILQGATTVHSFTGVTGTQADSLIPGTYTIRVYNSVSCFKDTTITLASPPLPSGVITAAGPLCTGGTTGSISVTGTAGTAPYTYALGAGGYSSSGSFTGLSTGSYVVHIRDAFSCTKDTTIAVPATPPILETLQIRKPTCNGYANGQVIVQAYNSVAPYTYSVGTGPYSSNDTFSALTPGTYIFHVMNANGCIDDTTITLVDSQYLHADLAITNITCNGGNASIAVTALGGYPAYTYAYNTSAYGPFGTFSLPAGTYTLHVNDQQSCFFDTTITITQPTPVTITTTTTPATCNGTATGSVTISASGGTPGYTYAVDAGTYGATTTISGLSAGAHTVRVKDANNCIFTSSITITEPTAISVDSIRITIPLCWGGNNGSAVIYAAGGTPGYTYAIGAGAYSSSSTFTTLSAGTYTLHIKDANNCVKDTNIIVADPPSMVPGAAVVPATCQTLANGQVTLSVSGGTPAYTYAMGTGSYTSSNVFSPLASGTYTFHIKDAMGCVKDTTVTVTNSIHVTASFTITQPLCNGDANGVVVVTGASGLSPYTYALGTGTYSSSGSFSGISAGPNTFHISDANGCISDTTITVAQPSIVFPVINITRPSCFGYSDGAIGVGGTGGTAPYTFALNGTSFITTTSFNSLAAGTDTITIQDAHGCLHDTVITITQPAPLGVSGISVTNVSCNGGADGMVTVTATGGTPAYQYAANAGSYQVSNVLTGFTAGIPVIHVRDANGCTKDTFAIITQPDPLVITGVNITNPTCEGYADGAFTVTVAGGTTPYRYSTDNISFVISATFNTLTEGSYTIFVNDNNGCIADTSVTLTGYPHIIIDSVLITPAGCAGREDGKVVLVASGGNPPLVYSLNGGAPTLGLNGFTALMAGTYTATITDNKNCKKDSIIVVPQPDTLRVRTQVTDNNCTGADVEGAVIANVTGGTGPYTYIWSNDTTGLSFITGLANGTYSVRVRDINNCEDSTSVTVTYDNCCTPYLPNAFSPNGDGNNDVYRMVYKGDITIIDFSIYNRFGERVFHTNNNTDSWNGTYKDEPCDIGSYYYYIKLYCGNKRNKVLEFKGDVTLVK